MYLRYLILLHRCLDVYLIYIYMIFHCCGVLFPSLLRLNLPICHQPKDMPRWWTMTGRPDQRNAGYMDPLMSLGAMKKILFLFRTYRGLYYIYFYGGLLKNHEQDPVLNIDAPHRSMLFCVMSFLLCFCCLVDYQGFVWPIYIYVCSFEREKNRWISWQW